MWGKPLDTCMLDVRFREKFEDALSVVISDQERAGLDILTHGDLHVDEDLAGRDMGLVIVIHRRGTDAEDRYPGRIGPLDEAAYRLRFRTECAADRRWIRQPCRQP